MRRIQKRQIPREALQHLAGGGTVSRDIVQHTGVHGSTADYARIRDYATRESSAAGRAMSNDLGGQATRAAASAAVAAAKAAQAAAQAAAAASSGGGSFSGHLAGGHGAGGILAIVHQFGATASHHIDPQGGNAFDIFGSKRRTIANALRSAHGRLGLRYVISNMQISSARSGWGWRGYTPITHSGDYGHWRHTHVSYDKGGWINEPVYGVGRSGKTYSFAEKRREFVSPHGRGGGTVVHNHYTVNAPHYVGNYDDLAKALVKMNGQNRLAVLQR
jgi:hypothetical protein